MNPNVPFRSELLVIALELAMQKWVEYPFLAMTTNAKAIAKMSMWMDPNTLGAVSGRSPTPARTRVDSLLARRDSRVNVRTVITH